MAHSTFPARFEFLDEIRDLVAEVAREGGFSEKEVYSLQLAADEAASNIIEHAYAGISNASLDVTCDMDDVRYEANSRTGNLLTMIKRRG